jgi:hemolysin activation/secretion protein
VRGFSRQSLSGDHGVFWRNELAWPMQLEWGLMPLSVRWYAGLDMGRVESRAQGAPSGDLGGVTLGASIQAGRAWLDVFGSQGVWRPTSMQREPAQVWARLSFSF